ncbi:hypothetical protein [Streptomyces sp. NPDC014623]|uniref:hypothetical protein n=1 Tax=Streptomyces sp. NPDC014623 TaxID=3364875 RepID=UPI0037034C70
MADPRRRPGRNGPVSRGRARYGHAPAARCGAGAPPDGTRTRARARDGDGMSGDGPPSLTADAVGKPAVRLSRARVERDLAAGRNG